MVTVINYRGDFMDFFSDLGKKLGDAAEATVSKANELVEVTKLNAQIASEEKQINKLYAEIGKIVFEHDKEDPNEAIADQCSQIIVAQENIEYLKRKIEEAKTTREE